MPGDAEGYEKWIQKALAGLQLPHMPQTPFQPADLPGDSGGGQQPASSSPQESPSIRILLVSDVDLPSASALAEYTLLQNNQVFDASRIDLCIACGPFCRDEDLLPYLKGKSRKQLQHLFEDDKAHNTGNHHHPNKANRSTSWSSVFFRTQEETAAMEGLVTAAISQLESIVCRVVFCPGNTDPMTTSTSPEDLRFTPNSRNVHRQWLPLAPGLGCAGLLFLDAPRSSSGVLQVKPPPGRRANQLIDYDSDEEVDGDCYSSGMDHDHRHHHHHHHHNHDSHSRGKPSSLKLTKVHGNDEMGGDSYCKTLEGLIQVAPPPQQSYPFDTNFSQTILVTQYFQPSPTPKRQPDDSNYSDEDDSNDNDNDSDTNVYGYQQDREDEGEADQPDTVTEASQDTKSASRKDSEEDDDDDDEEEEDDDNNSTGSNGIRPWPPEHSKFVDSPLAQEHLALEIASGGGTSQRPKDIQKGNVRIVIPGSLRERGEFCLVDMSLMEQVVMKSMAAASTASPKQKKSTFAWSVRNVEFHNMERLP